MDLCVSGTVIRRANDDEPSLLSPQQVLSALIAGFAFAFALAFALALALANDWSLTHELQTSVRRPSSSSSAAKRSEL